MYEMTRFIQGMYGKPVKKRKVSNTPRNKSIKIGCKAMLGTVEVTVVEKDIKYSSAFFVEKDGVRLPYSYSRDMLVVL